MKIYSITHNGRTYEYWYDRKYRTWYAAEVDEHGNLGESRDDYTKYGIMYAITHGHIPELKRHFI